ncbi:SUMF1/EgtB/PvdO family nonheme iron enzyme, partial [Moorena sp. SIO3H5]|uniref:SUMF1/EgtB/PvdO family nonheme iron enzyme n=1 Tax=Moorena sp. SIO3H5 TaxID=2607834 RepID=UPI0025EB7083
GEPSRPFRYQEKLEQITPLLQPVLTNELNNAQDTRKLGETLFEAIFDDVLRQEFVNFYQEAVRDKKQLLRIELDIDEQTIPEVAALPWEFMCLPDSANLGHRWLGTDPNIVFSRRRALWHSAPPIQLEKGEKLRIALAIAAPKDLGHVEYEDIKEALASLAQEQAERIELLPIVNPATPTAIDNLLEQQPHIFHFIGHGQMHNEAGEEVGKIALVKKVFKTASWMDAASFSELFNRWSPGVVLLQACESGMLSASQAFAGTASKIVQMNIPVVVAMQYQVSNITAIQFAYEFYERLAKGEPVDIAAQNGRRTIGLETGNRKRDFATPVIFMRLEDGYLFKREDGENGIEKSLLQNHQNSDPSNLSSQTSSNKIVATSNLRIQLPPTTKTFEFEVVKIDAKGREKRSCQQAEHFIETLSDTVGLEMVSIPGGQFKMGAPIEEEMSKQEERPEHIVTINPFFIGRYPITQAQWRVIANLPTINRPLEPEPSYFKGDKLSVERVSWYHAKEFCVRLSQKTGRQYRLPTEAEWEYACRAKTSTPFHFGRKITPNLANYNSKDHHYRQQTTEVGSFTPNAFGLWDMHGLVWEWCEDYDHENYQGAPLDGSAWLNDGSAWLNDGIEEYRILRGGSWDCDPNLCRSASRFSGNPSVPKKEFGFRVVCL